MKIAVVGAGIAGLSAAYDLLASGHSVVIYEANNYSGGLAAGFQDEIWQWPLERFYHHLFRQDKAIINLVEEIGMGDDLFWPRPVTSVIHDSKIVPFDSPIAWITFPGFNLVDVARFGLVSAYLRFTNPWKELEKQTANDWLGKWYGDRIYDTVWKPLLIGKFGPYYKEANMAWMWARLHVRSPRLGYFKGGFQTFVDSLASAVESRGGQIILESPVRAIEKMADGTISLSLDGGKEVVDQCLVTTSPGLFGRMAPELPENYLGKLGELKSMGAVVLVLALQHQLMKETYWLNLPSTSPDKKQTDIPFLALVEHTNYIDPVHYGGDRIVYCGDYVVPDHEYFDMTDQELESLFVKPLSVINPDFKSSWIRKSWVFRTRYAQPVPEINHSRNIPDIRTPIKNLFFASMSQVYPWDRGTNYAVEIGRKAASMMIER
ncbi:MAG TPA: NAD(P)/FAD-dependent oxidoreductase [candidate division Zixibacteria bacterium]|nr:NAD(P)/FAD-dependent oxidoreductase [candidate division Zixibacteria bacterium]